jgi:magnesium chelatase family protein
MQIEKYLAKISGPLMDGIAIHVTVYPVDLEMWNSSSPRMTSVEMCDRVARAREIQTRRFAGLDGINCNARLPDGLFSRFCPMESSAEALFVRAQKALLVTARARGHIVRVARTIADLDGSENVKERHISEAVGYRQRETVYEPDK